MASKGFSTSLSGALLTEVTEYANQGGMSVQDAMRELIRVGLSVVPQDAVMFNARQRAYDDSRRYVMEKFSEAVAGVSKDMEKALGLSIWGEKQPKHGG